MSRTKEIHAVVDHRTGAVSAAAPTGPGLDVLDLVLDEAAGVAVRGELELATASELSAALDEAIRASEGPFVIDLTNVDFLDSSGIACLIRARALLGRDDRELGLICPPGSTRRALELTGIDELVALYASRDELA
jgi:anti-sigma B factor antagonist